MHIDQIIPIVLSYAPQADVTPLKKAYELALKMHEGQFRHSGEPYIFHPLRVCKIMADYHLDMDTLTTAILHDIVEDTDIKLEKIETEFGKPVAALVDGVTKLSKIELKANFSREFESFRKLFIAMSQDIRVLLIKLGDRLDNMRTLHFIPKPEKRYRIAKETLDIFAPLAGRLGMNQLKDELEDHGFLHTQSEGRTTILKRLEDLKANDAHLTERIMAELKDLLQDHEIKAEVYGRVKAPYSIWNKMQKKTIEFEQLSDIMAFRVMVDTVADCYAALGILHSKYKMVPGRFKDFISTPKPNGYKSLHTGVIGPEQHKIEIQIRTPDMHRHAELGLAAHWQYKQGGSKDSVPQFSWVRDLLELLQQSDSKEDFLEQTKMDMFQDQVFVFTPKGELIVLPQGACLVDFAYMVHSEVGKKCVGGKVNGRIRQLNHILKNGDQVEILTSKTAKPSPDWESFIVTSKAKYHIKKFIKIEKRDQYVELGKQILQRQLKLENKSYDEKIISDNLKRTKFANISDMLFALGDGDIAARDIIKTLYPEYKPDPKAMTLDDIIEKGKEEKQTHKNSKYKIPIKGLIPGMAIHFAKCCHPLPGDRIVGIVTTGRGVTIHTLDCMTLENFSDTPERWLDVGWEDESKETKHVGRIKVSFTNEVGSIATTTSVISKHAGNIINLKLTNRSVDFFEMLIDVEVENAKQLNVIIANLRSTPIIASVDRV